MSINLSGVFRTSYFRVVDEAKYKELMAPLKGDFVFDFSKEKDGFLWHAFGNDYPLDHYEMDEDYIDELMHEISKIIHENDACILIQQQHDNLRWLQSDVFIVTKNHVDYRSLEHIAKEVAAERIGADNVETIKFWY